MNEEFDTTIPEAGAAPAQTKQSQTAKAAPAPAGGARDLGQLRGDVERLGGEVRAAKNAWAEALHQQERERAMLSGMKIYGEMRGLAARQELEKLQKESDAQDAIASAFAIARESGGQLPQGTVDFLNKRFGFDGKERGITGGGIQNGVFNLDFTEQGPDGNPVARRQSLTPEMQLGLMEGYPGIFGEDAVAKHRNDLVSEGFTEDKINAYSNTAKLARERLARRMDELSAPARGGRREAEGRNARSAAQGAPGAATPDLASIVKLLENADKLDDDVRASINAHLRTVFPRKDATQGGEGGANFASVKVGETFTAQGKDGKEHTYRKTGDKSYQRID